MIKKSYLKKLIFSIMLFLATLFLFSCGKGEKNLIDLTPKEEEIILATNELPYYKKTERILKLELKNKNLKDKINSIFISSNIYYEELDNAEKEIYTNLKESFLNLDYDNLNNNLEPKTDELEDDYITISTTSFDANPTELKKITDYFLLDTSGLFFLDYTYQIKDNKILFKTHNNIISNFREYLDLFLLNVNLIKEEALTIPIIDKRGRKIFELLIKNRLENLGKNKKSDLSNYLISYFLEDQIENKNNLAKLLNYIFNISYLKSFYTNGLKDNEYYNGLYIMLQDYYFFIDAISFINEPTFANLYRYYAIEEVQNFMKNYKVLDAKISQKSFNNNYKYTEGAITLINNRDNLYRNRIDPKESNDPYSKSESGKGKLSDSNYDPSKAPFSDFAVAGKNEFNYDYYYKDLNNNNTKSKTIPISEGAYLLYVKSVENDTYFEISIPYKIAKRHTVSFRGITNFKESDQNFSIFHNDYTDLPKNPIIDGYVFESFNEDDVKSISNRAKEEYEKFKHPITSDTTIEYIFRTPKLTFWDINHGENEELRNKFIALKEDKEILNSKNIIEKLNPLKNIKQNKEVFIGFRVAIKTDNETLELTQNFIGENRDKKEIPIIGNYYLIPEISNVDVKVKGTPFQKIKPQKDIPDSFRVHPKQRIPDLDKVSFGNKISTTGFKLSKPFEDIKKLDEYDITYIALGSHSIHEIEKTIHFQIDYDIFFTSGWLKNNWIWVLLVIILIILSPFLIKLIFKVIKKIKKSRKKRRREQEYAEEDELYEEELKREELRRKRKEELRKLKEERNINKNNELEDITTNSNDEIVEENKVMTEDEFKDFWKDEEND